MPERVVAVRGVPVPEGSPITDHTGLSLAVGAQIARGHRVGSHGVDADLLSSDRLRSDEPEDSDSERGDRIMRRQKRADRCVALRKLVCVVCVFGVPAFAWSSLLRWDASLTSCRPAFASELVLHGGSPMSVHKAGEVRYTVSRGEALVISLYDDAFSWRQSPMHITAVASPAGIALGFPPSIVFARIPAYCPTGCDWSWDSHSPLPGNTTIRVRRVADGSKLPGGAPARHYVSTITVPATRAVPAQTAEYHSWQTSVFGRGFVHGGREVAEGLGNFLLLLPARYALCVREGESASRLRDVALLLSVALADRMGDNNDVAIDAIGGAGVSSLPGLPPPSALRA